MTSFQLPAYSVEWYKELSCCANDMRGQWHAFVCEIYELPLRNKLAVTLEYGKTEHFCISNFMAN